MKNRLVRVLFAIFILVLLFSFLFGVQIFSSSVKTSNDYSRPGYSLDIYNETFNSFEFMHDKLGVSVGDAERKYIGEYSDFLLSYPKNIPSSYVTLREFGQTLVVSAQTYSYKNSDGISISWIPKRVVIESDGRSLNFANADPNGRYMVSFPMDQVSVGLSLSIEYSNIITISKDEINKELSRAYYDARYLDYLDKKLKYESALEIYNEYVADRKIYEEHYREYTEYLRDLEEYNVSKQRYDEYLVAKEKYDADYIRYLEYLRLKEELADEIAAYNEYAKKMEIINHRLSLIEGMKVEKTSLNRSLFGAITGGAVDQVLAEEDLLTSNVVGADKNVIMGARSATEEIRIFFDEYFALGDDVLKYRYYQVNYKSFKDNVVKLFQCLENLYENNMIKGIIDSKDRSEKYEILLAQLYYAANALSDEAVYNYQGTVAFDKNYKINGVNGRRSPESIIGNLEGYFVDKNIATPPNDDPYPDPVPEPNYTPVSKPEIPTKVNEPQKPIFVSEPKEPAAVEEPIAPAVYQNVNGILAKAPFSENSLEMQLIEAYRLDLISSRAELYLEDDLIIELGISVKKTLGAGSVTLTYHDCNGNPVGDITTELNTFAEINYVPAKPGSADGKYSYEFETWVDARGIEVDLTSVSADMLIYPRFKEKNNEFNVTWKIGDKLITEVLQYGADPVCPEKPGKEGDLNTRYVFKGWTPEPSFVTENVTYTAIFEKMHTVPGLLDGSINKTGDREISVNCGTLFGEKIDVSHLLEISAGNYSVKFVLLKPLVSRSPGDECVEFTVSEAEVLVMKKNSVNYLEFSVSVENGREWYSAAAFGSDGKPHNESFKFSVALPIEENGKNMGVIYYDEDEKLYAKSSVSSGKIAFDLNTGYCYAYVPDVFMPQISVISQDVSVIPDKYEAQIGELVFVNITLPLGTELISIYYIDEEGVRTLINEGKFMMPDSDVSIGVEIKKTVYTVTFISDGMVISSRKYHYGDTVMIPEGVSKANDEDYSYKFKYWAPLVTKVTENASYEAIYERIPLEKKDEGGLKISEGTLRIIMIVSVPLAVIMLGAIPSAILSVVFSIKRKKHGVALIVKDKSTPN